ncbi:hypothetical protein F441_21574, partial [Phytophthora nicotianae CJ01A1]
IVGRRLTRSENHDGTRELLQHMKGTFSEERLQYIISDNANAISNLVSSVFGKAVEVRQDPFHVIQRCDISCSESEWQGGVNSNLKQIERGDLYVHDNVFKEGGGKDSWRQIFETASVDTLALEANLQRSRQHNDSIKELLTKQIVFTETGKLSKADFFNSLCLAELDYEAAAGFLRKISSNGNQRLKLRRRSFATLAAKINCLATKTPPATNDPLRLFRFSSPNPCAETTPRELELLSQLFSALRQLNGIRKRRQVFVMVYDFATCVCAGIYPKTPAALITKWNNMKQQSNAAKLKIKLKLSPGIMAPLHYTPVQCKYYPNI